MKNGTAKEVYRKFIDDDEYWKNYLSEPSDGVRYTLYGTRFVLG